MIGEGGAHKSPFGNRAKLRSLFIGVTIVAILLFPSFSVFVRPSSNLSAQAVTPSVTTSSTVSVEALLTTTFTVTVAKQTTFGGDPAVLVTYTNNLNSTVSTTVFGIVHDAVGQVIMMTASDIVIPARGSESAILDVGGLAPGHYKVGVFAVSNSVAISRESMVVISL